MDCWVLGMIKRPTCKNDNPGIVFLIPNRTAATLELYITIWIMPKSTIVTVSLAVHIEFWSI